VILNFRLDLPSNKGVIYIVTLALVAMAVGCVSTNCYLAYIGKEAPQAFTLLTGSLIGSVSTMLVKTSPTQTTTQVAVQEQPVVVPVQPEPKP